MSTSAIPKVSVFPASVLSSATHDTIPNTDSTPGKIIFQLYLHTSWTPRNNRTPSSTTRTAIDRIRKWWGKYISWRENVRDDQIVSWLRYNHGRTLVWSIVMYMSDIRMPLWCVFLTFHGLGFELTIRLDRWLLLDHRNPTSIAPYSPSSRLTPPALMTVS